MRYSTKIVLSSLIFLMGLSLIGCNRLDPNSPTAKRQAAFKQLLRDSEPLGGMVLRDKDHYDKKTFIQGVNHFVRSAQEPWQYFDEPVAKSDQESSKADPDIWQKQQQFKQQQLSFLSTVHALDTLVQGDFSKQQAKQAYAAVEQQCTNCHKLFRRK